MGIESAIALIMAGGRGERMRASGTTTPKPLVELEGVPLLERNLTMLIRAGFQDIYVSVSNSSPDVGDFVSSRGVALGQGRARVQCLVESEPLGNIGSAAELRDAGRPVVVLFADNLITLDLESLLERHTQSRAALTAATHVEPFRIPFGQVSVLDGRITAYTEKPELQICVASGVYVLGPRALTYMERGKQLQVRSLVQRLLDNGELVMSFPHATVWVDVNDASCVARAEALLAERRLWHLATSVDHC